LSNIISNSLEENNINDAINNIKDLIIEINETKNEGKKVSQYDIEGVGNIYIPDISFYDKNTFQDTGNNLSRKSIRDKYFNESMGKIKIEGGTGTINIYAPDIKPKLLN
jgi:hypothetical protein